MEGTNISRRNFLHGAGVAAVSLAAASALAGCSPGEQGSSEKSSKPVAYTPDETVDYDIVVVGSGSSGVAATVQAAELGASVLLLEKEFKTGGNGRMTEGMFGSASSFQKKEGIDITFREVIATEQEFFNYRINNLLWKDMVEASGENIDWMISHGVKFSGVVDNYYGLGKMNAFHWFEGPGDGSNYIDPMIAAAESMGAVVMTSTPAVDLLIEGDTVKGLYAEKEGGGILLVNAKAVILTSGGYANNSNIMMERGYDLTYSINNGVPGHDGDGLRMAISAGANDVSRQRCFLREPYSFGIDFFAPMTQNIHRGGPVLWVNQEAERYVSEAAGAVAPGCNSNAVHSQAKSYLIMSQDVVDSIVSSSGYKDLQKDMDDAVSQNPAENIFKADSIEELAKMQGLDSTALKATVNRYNELCAGGLDEDFNKPAELMVALKTAPYYIFRQDLAFWTSIGGIDTNRNMQAVNELGEPIPGLYSAGTDGCNLYRETYTMNVPASCNANNCHSGRLAAKNAVAAYS